jgi:hypothetical protein
MSDVYATLKFAAIQTTVRHDEARMNAKISGYFRWFKMLRELEHEGTFNLHVRGYEDALTAVNEAGYSGKTPAETIRELISIIADLEKHP